MNNAEIKKEIGALVQALTSDTKELHDLTIEGTIIAGSLRLIAEWLESLNNPDKTRKLTFESHSRSPETTFRVSNAQGIWEVPQDLLGHMKEVLHLQERIENNRKQLKEMLGIDTYAEHEVSIHEPSDE